ncbi:MAG: homogentisate 1,2-dioxygenase [Proteobacteria bacterium]|nr:homogentisate 1,2-dioxygenase [Pseudomonadota bacterium]
MPYFMQLGTVPRKRFSQFRKEDGSLFHTEVMGEEGFSSNFSLLHHIHPPAAIVAHEAVQHPPVELVDNHPLLPRLLQTKGIPADGNAVDSRFAVCGNEDVVASFVAADRASPLYRNANGDELFFIHDGSARLDTVLGALEVGSGDYVVIPKGLTHRWVPGPSMRGLVFETRGHIRSPDRYLSPQGQYLQMAPYSELDLRRPQEPLLVEGRDVDVLVRSRNGMTRYTYAQHPFDVVGWFGCNYPYALNVSDFSPMTGSFHRPPPVHQVFEAPNLVFCNFVPRVLDYDPRAMPIPSFHQNVDSDEMIFYAEGNFFSRKGSGIERGAISLHPAGHIHGPHPGSTDNAADRVGKRTEEVAIMLDTFRPLQLGKEIGRIEQPGYLYSWRGKAGQ